MSTLKLHSNGPLCSNTVIDTLPIDGWAVTFGTARRGLNGPHSNTVIDTLPIDGWAVTFGTGLGVYGWRTTARISRRRHDLQDQRSWSHGHVISLSRVGPMAHKSKTKSRTITKIGTGYPTTRATLRISFNVDGWAVTFGTVRRGLGGLGHRPVPSSLYQM